MKKKLPDVGDLMLLALRAGAIIKRDFSPFKPPEQLWKQDNTPVTSTDFEINELVLEYFRQEFPHIRVKGEEGSQIVSGAEYTVFCDPLDGTIPFVTGTPDSSFAIAIVKEGKPLLALIHDPFYDRTWHAVAGDKTYLNGTPVRVSQHAQLHQAYISMVYWREAQYNMHAVCEKVMATGAKWKNPTSVALYGGLVATGHIHAVITPANHSLETAAMHLIVEGAGGRVTNIHGDQLIYTPDGDIAGHIMSNGPIHDELVQLVRQCQK